MKQNLLLRVYKDLKDSGEWTNKRNILKDTNMTYTTKDKYLTLLLKLNVIQKTVINGNRIVYKIKDEY